MLSIRDLVTEEEEDAVAKDRLHVSNLVNVEVQVTAFVEGGKERKGDSENDESEDPIETEASLVSSEEIVLSSAKKLSKTKRKRIRSPEAEGEVGKIIVDATIRANFGISTRGVSRFFTTQISREWDSIQPNLQVALYNLMVFPSSFSLEAASTVLKFLTEANTNAVQTAALAATNMIHIDPTTGRCEINERVRNVLRKKAFDMKWDVQETKKILVRTKKRFMDYFLGELNRFEQDCRVDTVDAYTIASKNFDLERQNILHALSIAAEEGHESYRKVCLTGSYLMRYTLDGETRLKLYGKVVQNLDRDKETLEQMSWEDKKGHARLLLAYGRACCDSLSYKQAEDPLKEGAECLARLLSSCTSILERKSIITEIAAVKQNLARLYNGVGQYEQALPAVMEALTWRKRAGEAGTIPVAVCLGVLGESLQGIGDDENAEQVFKSELDLFEKNNMKNSHDCSIALQNMAKMAVRSGNLLKARRLLEDALNRISKSSLPYKNYSYLEGLLLQDLALTYTGKVEESMYQRYLQLAMKYFGMSGFSKKKVEMERLLAQRKVPRRDKTS